MWDVPQVVQNKATAAGAEQWLADLPALVAYYEQTWGISVGSVYEAGTEAFVAQATEESGRLAVLKLLIPRQGIVDTREIQVLELTQGAGCAELYRSDADAGAMLMERLGPSLFDLGIAIEERLAILSDAASQMWRPVRGIELPNGSDKAASLANAIERWWRELAEPCSRHAIEHALDCAAKRQVAHSTSDAVLVHGDVHQWNALQSTTGFKLVDPDGLIAEPEYDLGVLMREDPLELLADSDPHERSRWLAARTGCDEQAIWEWGVVERVSTGLLATQIDLQPVGSEMLHAAEVIAAQS